METLVGRVVEFDERRGLGVVESAAGRQYTFHCTAIADGTRTIPAQATVEFCLVPGPVGCFEAGAIRAIG
jgi:cold shock CspA family protein